MHNQGTQNINKVKLILILKNCCYGLILKVFWFRVIYDDLLKLYCLERILVRQFDPRVVNNTVVDHQNYVVKDIRFS